MTQYYIEQSAQHARGIHPETLSVNSITLLDTVKKYVKYVSVINFQNILCLTCANYVHL